MKIVAEIIKETTYLVRLIAPGTPLDGLVIVQTEDEEEATKLVDQINGTK